MAKKINAALGALRTIPISPQFNDAHRDVLGNLVRLHRASHNEMRRELVNKNT